jgi:single-stranded-DNA-specific exonuclease
LFAKKLGASNENHLELAAVATIADLVKLTDLNRIIVKFGLEKLEQTERIGLKELFKEAGISDKIGTYEIGHIIAPRINAMGRMEYAMESLRLLCTPVKSRAKDLAEKLSATNKKRQNLTGETTLDAIEKARLIVGNKKLIFVSDKEYNQGIIGLVAGKLVEEFYLPSIVVWEGDELSKASARSIAGFNIVEFIRKVSDLLVDVGGHPMAAGFTVKTSNLPKVKKKLEELAEQMVTSKMSVKEIKVDVEISLNLVNIDFYREIEKLEPFGIGNPQPTFLTKSLTVQDIRLVGADGKHLKLYLRDESSGLAVSAIAFGFGEKNKLKIGDKVNAIYTISADEWNGNTKVSLKIKQLT